MQHQEQMDIGMHTDTLADSKMLQNKYEQRTSRESKEYKLIDIINITVKVAEDN